MGIVSWLAVFIFFLKTGQRIEGECDRGEHNEEDGYNGDNLQETITGLSTTMRKQKQ